MAKTPNSMRIDFVTGSPVRYLPRIERLGAIVDRVEQIVERCPEDALRRRPGEGGWSPTRRLGHIIASARHAHQDIYRMSWQTDPLLNVWDDAAEAEQEAWEARDRARLLGWFLDTAGETLELLRELPDSSWGRSGQHPELGRRSIGQQVTELSAYLEQQATALEESIAAASD